MDEALRLDGRVALVTGASSGIGKGTAQLLAARGARMAVHYHRGEAAAAAVADGIRAAGGEALMVGGDVTRSGDVERMVATVLSHYGQIDILVNNAGGLVRRGPVVDCDEETWDRIIALNLKSVYLCTRAVLPAMQARRRGVIINITSGSARIGGLPGVTVTYGAAKAAVIAFTRGLALEVAGQGLRVNCVAPGLVDTPLQDPYREWFARRAPTLPLGRAGQPGDVAQMIAFLAADAAGWVTGETFYVTGGG